MESDRLPSGMAGGGMMYAIAFAVLAALAFLLARRKQRPSAGGRGHGVQAPSGGRVELLSLA